MGVINLITTTHNDMDTKTFCNTEEEIVAEL